MSAQPKTSVPEDHATSTYHTTTHADGTQVIEVDFERGSSNREQAPDQASPAKFKKQSLTEWLKSRWYDLGVVLMIFTCTVALTRC